jgi:hypothetical protein
VGASRSRLSPRALESAFPEATGRMACKARVGQSSWPGRQPASPRSRPELPRGRTGDPRLGFALPFHGQSPLLVGRVALSARRDPCLRQFAPPFLPQPSTPADLTERPSSRAPTPSGLHCPSESETYRPPLREMYVRPLFMPLRVTAEVCPSCCLGNWEAQIDRICDRLVRLCGAHGAAHSGGSRATAATCGPHTPRVAIQSMSVPCPPDIYVLVWGAPGRRTEPGRPGRRPGRTRPGRSA